jgi:hypothetical protein
MPEHNNPNEFEVKRNYEIFMQKLPELLQTYRGKFALMHAGQTIEFFDTAGDAYRAGSKLYQDRRFSIQQVIDSPVDLGYFSHALPQRTI